MASKNQFGLYEADIDGQIYTFEKWGAEDALDTLIDIAKIVGKPLGSLVGAVVGGEGLDQQFDPNMLAVAFEGLTGNMDKAVVKGLIKKLSSERCFCDGAKINFNKHYESKLAHLFKVVYAALEVQYGDFFGELTGLLGDKGKALRKA